MDLSDSDDTDDSKESDKRGTGKTVKVNFTPGSKGTIENLRTKNETLIDLTKTSKTKSENDDHGNIKSKKKRKSLSSNDAKQH